MSVNLTMVKHVAHLARIALDNKEVQCIGDEINAMLEFIKELDKVDVTGVESMISVTHTMTLYMHKDVVEDSGIACDIVANAPITEGRFFLVPKVIE